MLRCSSSVQRGTFPSVYSDSMAKQREECKSLKNVDLDGSEGDDGSSPYLAKIEIVRDIRNRVKLYVLCDQRMWDDKGTGHVACVQSPEHQGATFLVVRLEQNGISFKFFHNYIICQI
ncbi:hypothetical protein AB6A40_008008 [Gnathostoma spinigerum]|uniref:Uncharacterized protein n=1 Tax=Gnathostoma spinigerum TaxID=75299 RepID=A0ABD6EMU9_9BILA